MCSNVSKARKRRASYRRCVYPWLVFVFAVFAVSSYLMLLKVGLEERRVRTQIFQEQQWINASSSSASSFGACLLVMDDNHFLIEWLAYHYHVLPLRDLIVAIDPRSKTNPQPIFNRWRDLINITVWTDAQIMRNVTELEEAEEWVRLKFAQWSPSPQLIRHRARQRLFYYHCLQQQKKNQQSYVLLTDSDEYLSVNYPTLIDMYGKEVADAVPIAEPGSVMKLLKYHRNLYPDSNLTSSPCIQIPRLRYGTEETGNIQQQLPLTLNRLNASHFATLRWRKHANNENYQQNRISKTIIDVSRMDERHFRPVDSIHRPVRHYCGRRKLHIRPNHQILLIHHYIGTYEQYTARDDARLGQERSDDMFRQAARINQASNDMIVGWLQGFERSIGAEKAHYLLQNVGQVTKSK